MSLFEVYHEDGTLYDIFFFEDEAEDAADQIGGTYEEVDE